MTATSFDVRENPVMMEALEDRQLYSVSLTPSIPIPPPSPSGVSRIVVVQPASQPAPTPNVVISIIAILIG